jgi:quinol monooxygenase YgiN
MICALTVRQLKPGTFEEFRKAFMEHTMRDGNPPEGFVRFNMLRSTENPDEVICFGFYDGTPEELRGSAEAFGYDKQQEAIAPYVESVGTDGLYDIVEDYKT